MARARTRKAAWWSGQIASLPPVRDRSPPTHPYFGGKACVPADVVRLLEASTPEEWNAAVATIVGSLALLAAPGRTMGDADFRFFLRLENTIARGFQPAPHRMPSIWQARADAEVIRGNWPGRPDWWGNPACDRAEAAARLVAALNIKPDQARKRVARAVRVAGLVLPAGRPFGRKAPPSFR